MSFATCRPSPPVPPELLALRERIGGQPTEVREALGPLIEEAVEDAYFRQQVLTLARESLERFRLDLELAKFDLSVTRRERETLARELEGFQGTRSKGPL
jgi:hypothetical protein